MLRVGVRLEAAITNAGEYLADVSALEAAGADSIWLDVKDGGSAEPWIVLGAISAVTQRIRVGMTVDAAGGWPPATDLLARLARGRLIVGVRQSPNAKEHIELFAKTRSDMQGPAILVVCATLEEAKMSALAAGGVIVPGDEEDVRTLRALHAESEVWIEMPIPPDRAGWAKAIAANQAAGATGILVPWDARLIDLLRSAGEPDDRTDLLIATG